MDADIMIDVLPSLAHDADKFARLLAPNGSDTSPATWKDIRRTGTKLSKLYQHHQIPFNLHKRSFGTQEYVRPRNVLRALLGVQPMDEVPSPPWRPDNILLKANLAEMLNTILVVCDNDQWTSTGSDALERLHAAFPDAIAGGEFSFNTLAFFLDLTAHLTIRRIDASIESEPNFSPHAVIDNLFFDDDGAFRHMEDLGLTHASGNDQKRALESIEQAAEGLKNPFNTGGAGTTAANGKLKAKYRWDYLRTHTLKFYEQRTNRLSRRIARAGGIEQILQVLAREVEQGTSQRQADEIRQNAQKHTSTPRASLAGMAALKGMEDSLMEQDSAPAASVAAPVGPIEPVEPMEPIEPVEPIEQPTTDAPHVDIAEQDFAKISDIPPKPAAQPIAPSDFRSTSSYHDRQLQRQKKSPQRPKGRFIDPQPNAVRLEWNEDGESQQASPRPAFGQGTQSRHPQSLAKGKRTLAEMEDESYLPDPTQDEGFQTDTRDMSAADQRRKEVTFARDSRPAPRYPSIDPVSSAAGPSNYVSSTAPEARPSPNKRQRLNPGSSLVPFNELPPTGTDLPGHEQYSRAKIYARQHSAVANTRKPQQMRRPWTAEEESALMELIEEHGGEGVSYAVLKNIDAARQEQAMLTHRSPEDLRFKARNMKVTMLLGLSRDGLPMNWEHIVLDKKAIEKVRSRGVNYVQERQRGLLF